MGVDGTDITVEENGDVNDSGTQGKIVNYTGSETTPTLTIFWISSEERTVGPDLTESTYFSYATTKFHTITKLEVFGTCEENGVQKYDTNGWIGMPGRLYVNASGNGNLYEYDPSLNPNGKFSCISLSTFPAPGVITGCTMYTPIGVKVTDSTNKKFQMRMTVYKGIVVQNGSVALGVGEYSNYYYNKTDVQYVIPVTNVRGQA